MKIPHADKAIIAEEKILDYLLNQDHRRGGAKARLLVSIGYQRDEWKQLERDIREKHLTSDIKATIDTEYGIRYEIVGPLGVSGRRKIDFRSIWQVDTGTDTPRLITIYPE